MRIRRNRKERGGEQKLGKGGRGEGREMGEDLDFGRQRPRIRCRYVSIFELRWDEERDGERDRVRWAEEEDRPVADVIKVCRQPLREREEAFAKETRGTRVGRRKYELRGGGS